MTSPSPCSFSSQEPPRSRLRVLGAPFTPGECHLGSAPRDEPVSLTVLLGDLPRAPPVPPHRTSECSGKFHVHSSSQPTPCSCDNLRDLPPPALPFSTEWVDGRVRGEQEWDPSPLPRVGAPRRAARAQQGRLLHKSPQPSTTPTSLPTATRCPRPRPCGTCCHNPAASEETEAQRTQVPKVTQGHTTRKGRAEA